jgi:hypothetical protein
MNRWQIDRKAVCAIFIAAANRLRQSKYLDIP